MTVLFWFYGRDIVLTVVISRIDVFELLNERIAVLKQ